MECKNMEKQPFGEYYLCGKTKVGKRCESCETIKYKTWHCKKHSQKEQKGEK